MKESAGFYRCSFICADYNKRRILLRILLLFVKKSKLKIYKINYCKI